MEVEASGLHPALAPINAPVKVKLKLGGAPSPVMPADASMEASNGPALAGIALPAPSTTQVDPPPVKAKRKYVRKKDPAKPGPGKNWRKGVKGAPKPVQYDDDGNRMYSPEAESSTPKPKASRGKKVKADGSATPEASGTKITVPFLPKTPKPRQWHRQDVAINNVFGKPLSLPGFKADVHSPLFEHLARDPSLAPKPSLVGKTVKAAPSSARKTPARMQEIYPEPEPEALSPHSMPVEASTSASAQPSLSPREGSSSHHLSPVQEFQAGLPQELPLSAPSGPYLSPGLPHPEPFYSTLSTPQALPSVPPPAMSLRHLSPTLSAHGSPTRLPPISTLTGIAGPPLSHFSLG